jgi:hypothetical protein
MCLLLLAACSGSGPVSIPGSEYDCRENEPGTGDLADETVIRTWTSHKDDEVEYVRHSYAVDGDVVAIEDYGILLSFGTTTDGGPCPIPSQTASGSVAERSSGAISGLRQQPDPRRRRAVGPSG